MNPQTFWQDKLCNYLDQYNVNYIRNTTTLIPPYSIDIYLPEHNVAISVYNLYKQSIIKGNKDKDELFNKWQQCKNKNIDLYQYFEDELRNSYHVVESKLRYITKSNTKILGARKCAVYDVPYCQEKEFLDEFHIQGSSPARSKSIAAYHAGDVVAILGWQVKRLYLEITRFACDTSYSHPGLFSKMMKYMLNETKFHGDIVSFSNNGHSNGGVYNASGFTNVKVLKGAYWYTYDYLERENRQGYMKQKIKAKFNLTQEYVDSHTEWEMMQELDYDRVVDSGKIKWCKVV